MIKLTYQNGKTTAAYWLLHSAAADDGVLPSGAPRHRAREYNTLERLTKEGLMETRRSGPRGGIRYHITDSGLAALKSAATA